MVDIMLNWCIPTVHHGTITPKMSKTRAPPRARASTPVDELPSSDFITQEQISVVIGDHDYAGFSLTDNNITYDCC